jgi:3-oxoacyl-[acyl-carrier-protein] synthase-3
MSPIYLHAVAVCLPRGRDRAADAVRENRYEAKYAEATDYESVAVCRGGRCPADLAVAAAHAALGRAGVDPRDLDLVSYSHIHDQGHPDLWAPAAYLQRRLDAGRARAFSVNHGCNAQLLACELLMDVVSAGRANEALVSGADMFGLGTFDRWRSDFVAYGDAGSAMLLGSRPRGTRIASLVSQAECGIEGLHRFAAAQPNTGAGTHPYRELKRAYLEQHGGDILVETTRRAVSSLWAITARRTGWDAGRITHVVFPNLGRKVLESSYFPVFRGAHEKSSWYFGRTVGHLGTADCAAGLTELAISGRLRSGDRALLIGAGAGFSFSMMALDIQEPPHAAFVSEEAS